MQDKILSIRQAIENRIYNLADEKATQNTIEEQLLALGAKREYRLSDKDVVDFFLDGIAIEVKVKGQATAILRQCEGYCAYDEVKALVLVTGRSMGFPVELNSKPCYYISLSRGML